MNPGMKIAKLKNLSRVFRGIKNSLLFLGVFFVAGFIFFGFNINSAEAANVTIDAGAAANSSRNMRSMVFTTPKIGYYFFNDADNDLKYVKTTDGGASWNGLTTIYAG